MNEAIDNQYLNPVTGVKDGMEIENYLNNLFENDCLNALSKFPSNSIDMILCDLPYGTTENRWDSVIPLEKLWKKYERVIKDRGAIILTSHGPFTGKLMMSNIDVFKYKIVWVKSKATNFLNAKKQPLRKHEDILVFYKKHPTYNPQMKEGEAYDKGVRKDQYTGSYGKFEPSKVESDGKRYPTDVIYFKTAESEGEVWHPVQKPVELGRYLVRTFTNPGDIVMDNAFGSGSFLVSALLEGRNFIGIEKNENSHRFKENDSDHDYIEIAKKRLKKGFEEIKENEPKKFESIEKRGLIKDFSKNTILSTSIHKYF